MKLEHFLTPYTKIKWIKDLNLRLETIQLQKENTGRTLFDIIMAIFVFDLSPKTEGIKAKINIWNLIKKLLHNKGNHRQKRKENLLIGREYLQMI